MHITCYGACLRYHLGVLYYSFLQVLDELEVVLLFPHHLSQYVECRIPLEP